MKGIRTSVWLVAALAVTLAACSKSEAPKPEAAAPAMEEKPMAAPMEEQPMAPSEGMAPSEEMAPSGEMGSGGEMAPSEQMGEGETES
jgi:hypothetical protein